jgi:hypothetical protein
MIELLVGAVPVILAWTWRFGYDNGRSSGQMRRLGLGDGKALVIDTKALGQIKMGLGKLEVSAKKSSEQMDEFYRAYHAPIITDPLAVMKITGVSA